MGKIYGFYRWEVRSRCPMLTVDNMISSFLSDQRLHCDLVYEKAVCYFYFYF